MGYYINSQILNASDFGIPQNRKRLFVIASLKKAKLEIEKWGMLNLDLMLKLQPWHFLDLFIKEKWLSENKHYQKNKKEKYYSKNGRVQIPFFSYVSENKVTLVSPDYEEATVPTITAKGALSRQWLAFPWPKRKGRFETEPNNPVVPFIIDNKKWAIRRMAPSENWVLMGLYWERAFLGSGFSDFQLKKLAGNSIVKNILIAIFKEVYKKGLWD